MDEQDQNTNEDFEIEADEEYTEENLQDALKKTKAKLKQAEKERQEYLTGWQRTKADYINNKKRSEEESREFVKFANTNLISEFIPVLDSFEMAFANKEAWEKVSPEWRKGVEYIYSQFLSVLTSNGVSQINPIGQTFDPNLHEAVATIDTKDPKDDHKVLEVIQKGYSLNGKHIRTAKVKIGTLIAQ